LSIASFPRIIRSFRQTYGFRHLDLAYHAAFPFAVTSELLYCLRENFLPNCPWIAVPEVLLFPWFDSVGDDLYEMDPEVRAVLLRDLGQDSRFGEARLQELARFMTAYVTAKLPSNPRVTRDLGRDFDWLALACLPGDEASRKLRQRLRDAIAEGRDDERQRWLELAQDQQDVLRELGLEPAVLDGEEDSFPPLETFEFRQGYFEPVTASDEVDLEPFTFATVQLKKVESEVETEPSQGQGWQFLESLFSPEMAFTLEMVQIPKGTFLMGAAEGEDGAQDNESPQHSVTVPKFFLGKYQVTQAQWRAVATGLPKIEHDLNPDPSKFKGDTYPVEQVNWYEAVEFCQRLSQATGRDYRLPSEAEWEYACRAGTTTPFSFGELITTDVANYNGHHTYGQSPKGDYRKQTTPVGSFSANGFGLYDMHGNVWEWCFDLWHDNYEGAPTNGSPWVTGKEKSRLLRGGSWYDYPGLCRSAYRYWVTPDFRDDSFGFRVCCSVARTP
jgi:formylglycine-generating enzyme required for sulfatase activity